MNLDEEKRKRERRLAAQGNDAIGSVEARKAAVRNIRLQKDPLELNDIPVLVKQKVKMLNPFHQPTAKEIAEASNAWLEKYPVNLYTIDMDEKECVTTHCASVIQFNYSTDGNVLADLLFKSQEQMNKAMLKKTIRVRQISFRSEEDRVYRRFGEGAIKMIYVLDHELTPNCFIERDIDWLKILHDLHYPKKDGQKTKFTISSLLSQKDTEREDLDELQDRINKKRVERYNEQKERKKRQAEIIEREMAANKRGIIVTPKGGLS